MCCAVKSYVGLGQHIDGVVQWLCWSVWPDGTQPLRSLPSTYPCIYTWTLCIAKFPWDIYHILACLRCEWGVWGAFFKTNCHTFLTPAVHLEYKYSAVEFHSNGCVKNFGPLDFSQILERKNLIHFNLMHWLGLGRVSKQANKGMLFQLSSLTMMPQQSSM